MSDIFGPVSLTVTQAVASFGTFLPKLSDIRKADVTTDHEFVADVRTGEVAAVALTVGVGAVASYLTKSNTPAVIAVLVAVGLVVMYESALRSNRSAAEPQAPVSTEWKDNPDE